VPPDKREVSDLEMWHNEEIYSYNATCLTIKYDLAGIMDWIISKRLELISLHYSHQRKWLYQQKNAYQDPG